MHKISRKSLASLVCPSAPFLVPRLLRTAVPAAAATPSWPPSQCPQRATYATANQDFVRKVAFEKKKHEPRYSPRYEEEAETARLVNQLRNACETRNIELVMQLYPTMMAGKMLNSYDTRRITQALHVRVRNEHVANKRLDFLPFVQQLVTDVRRGLLEPHHYAFVHLFGIYKECACWTEGYALWEWLVRQDERYVSQAAYGAAIELMAYGGLMRLPELEDLYTEGLKRFPGTFAEYHLSPDAIVPDRSQLNTITGIPTILLQGILTARVLAHDWCRAYLALDTALRIFPTQTPTRYFELFMAERPINEAYTAFMLACRAGICLRPTHVTALLTKLRSAISASQSMPDRMMLLRAIANALYGYLEAGAQLESIHVASLIRAFELILPPPMDGEDYVGEEAKLRNMLAVAAHELLAGLVRAGMAPQAPHFEALVSIAGKLRVPNLLTTALEDLQTANLELTTIGTRSVITSAGLLKNKALIEEHWSRVAATAEKNRGLIPFEDWLTFAKACRKADHADYLRSQLLKLPHAITERTERIIVEIMDQPKSVFDASPSFRSMTREQLQSELSLLKRQMSNIETAVMSGQPLDLRATPFYMHIDPDYPPLAMGIDLWAIYDKLTTDPHQPPPPPSADGRPVKAALSSTGIPLDELRFLNWVTIHEMMDSADIYESDLLSVGEAALKAKEQGKRLTEILRLRKRDFAPYSRADLERKIRQLRTPRRLPGNIVRKVDTDGPSLMAKKDGEVPVRKHVAKDGSETIVQGGRGAPRLIYYLGLESDAGGPDASKNGKRFRKVTLKDGAGRENVEVLSEESSSGDGDRDQAPSSSSSS